jgi:hypothetical protein
LYVGRYISSDDIGWLNVWSLIDTHNERYGYVIIRAPPNATTVQFKNFYQDNINPSHIHVYKYTGVGTAPGEWIDGRTGGIDDGNTHVDGGATLVNYIKDRDTYLLKEYVTDLTAELTSRGYTRVSTTAQPTTLIPFLRHTYRKWVMNLS